MLVGKRWQLEVRWEEPTDGVLVTWEPLTRLFKDVPVMVLAYVRRVQDPEQRDEMLSVLKVKSRHAGDSNARVNHSSLRSRK